MEDLVEVVVSRLKVEAQLSGLRLVQLIAGLKRSKKSATTEQETSRIKIRTCIVDRVSSQETSFALPCQSTGRRLSLLKASAKS